MAWRRSGDESLSEPMIVSNSASVGYLLHLSIYLRSIYSRLKIFLILHQSSTRIEQMDAILECGIWYYHPRRLQCVWRRNLRIFKVATWHYRCRHNLKNNCIWDNLQCCLLVPRSPSKPVMLTLTCNLAKCNSLRSSFGMYNLERQLRYWHLLTRHCPCDLLPEPTSPKHEYREKLWGHPVTSSMTSSP